MLKVGLTGGYATGKSFVASEFAALGCHLIYADELGHQVLMPGAEAYEATVEAFGPEILGDDGAIDRKRLASIVFASPDLLMRLSSFVHPAVYVRTDELIREIDARDSSAIVMVEAAILIETGRFKEYERLIVTTCGEQRQIERGIKRDGITREEVLARIHRQLPLSEKIKVADYVVETDGGKEETRARVRQIHQELMALAENRGV